MLFPGWKVKYPKNQWQKLLRRNLSEAIDKRLIENEKNLDAQQSFCLKDGFCSWNRSEPKKK